MKAQDAVTRLSLAGAEGDRIVGEEHGTTGRPVLFLHGGGQTRHAWDRAVADIAEQGARAIALDLRGHGQSDHARSGRYGFDAYAEDLVAMVEQIAARDGQRPAVVGASLGGLSALLAEARNPGLLEALVLVDITPDMDVDGVARIQGFMGENLEDGFASLEDAADAIARYLPNRNRPRSLEGLSKNLRLGADGRYRWHWDPRFLDPRTGINADAVALMTECYDAIPRLGLPILLVRGMQSELVNEASAKSFAARAPDATYVDIRDAGHMVAGDRNDVFTDAVVHFLKRRLLEPSSVL